MKSLSDCHPEAASNLSETWFIQEPSDPLPDEIDHADGHDSPPTVTHDTRANHLLNAAQSNDTSVSEGDISVSEGDQAALPEVSKGDMPQTEGDSTATAGDSTANEGVLPTGEPRSDETIQTIQFLDLSQTGLRRSK